MNGQGTKTEMYYVILLAMMIPGYHKSNYHKNCYLHYNKRLPKLLYFENLH